MTKGWTEERRRKQAETIRKNKPWLKSTGPKTQKGKDTSSLNALKHGDNSAAMSAYKAALTLNTQFINQIQLACLKDKRLLQAQNKLKEKRFKTIT